MYLYYCPKCGKIEIVSEYSKYKEYMKERTCANIRDGYGRPIQHIKYNCGNYLAGLIILPEEYNSNDIDYFKSIIIDYNENGTFFENGLLQYAIKSYEYSKNFKFKKK